MSEVTESLLARSFIRTKIDEDLANSKIKAVVTRFPPEPNGFLHIGHAKTVHLNFGIAKDYAGKCHLRFDDTNPEKEDMSYVEAIIADVQWLGGDWQGHLYYASDYFDKLYECAETLINKGKAYVCSLSAEEIRQSRGTLTESGAHSPYRQRTVSENLSLLQQMRQGVFKAGEHVLRAKIAMDSGNINMRDPVMYRILNVPHYRQKNAWHIYPMYDYAHCVSDAIEGITHSLCTLEFQDHRPLYDWFLAELNWPTPRPEQIEFARLELNYSVMSKRKLKILVEKGLVTGWDDPRLPTIKGLRKRGYTKESIKAFCERIGVAKKNTIIDLSTLEACIRDDLNHKACRALAVMNPLRVTIENLKADETLTIEAPNHPQRPEMGRRTLHLSKNLYIEQEDFMEIPVAKYQRLAPGRKVKLRYGCVIECLAVVKDQDGKVTEVIAKYEPDSVGKSEMFGAKGIIHWVSAAYALSCVFNIYDRLFKSELPPNAMEAMIADVNPESFKSCSGYVESTLNKALPETHFQFERLGYFVCQNNSQGVIEFNRTVTLRDTWVQK